MLLNDIKPERIYGVVAVAEFLGCEPSYVRILARDKVLHSRRAGGAGHIKITGASLLAYIDGSPPVGHD